jgi:plasmid replication initiation protein
MPTRAIEIVKSLSEKAKRNALKTYPARAKKTENPGGLSVNMSNSLTNAAHRLTLSEKRIMMFAISKIDSRRSIGRFEKDDGLKVVIPALEYAKLFKIERHTAYVELKESVEKLYGRSISFKSAKKTEGGEVRWITDKYYSDGEGWCEIKINGSVLPALMELHTKFVSYKLQQASALRSVYSWRLLELLTQFKRNGWRQDKIADFVHAIGAKETYSSNFAQLRRWVIEPAVKELTEKDGWQIKWDPIKEGRKVVAIRFDFKRSPQQSLPL